MKNSLARLNHQFNNQVEARQKKISKLEYSKIKKTDLKSEQNLRVCKKR